MIRPRPRVLPEPAVAWLRQLHATPAPGSAADPVDTACLLGLMAHHTPAWTEGYVALLDRLIEPRIKRSAGPAEATGSAAGLPDLLVLLGVRAMITPDDRWNRADGGPGDGAWTHDELAAHVAGQGFDDPVARLGVALHANRHRAPEPVAPVGGEASPDGDTLGLPPTPAAALEWDLGGLARLVAAPVTRCGQLVDVDTPAVVLSRAEWVDEVLHVQLAVAEELPIKRTMFRLVGTEPRMWYLTGISGTTMDSAGAAVVVRVPHVNGELEFAAGSY